MFKPAAVTSSAKCAVAVIWHLYNSVNLPQKIFGKLVRTAVIITRQKIVFSCHILYGSFMATFACHVNTHISYYYWDVSSCSIRFLYFSYITMNLSFRSAVFKACRYIIIIGKRPPALKIEIYRYNPFINKNTRGRLFGHKKANAFQKNTFSAIY